MKNRLRKMMLGIMVCLCLIAMPVYAAEDLSSVFDEGVAYAKEEKYEESLESFLKALELATSQEDKDRYLYDIYRNIALCYMNLDMDYKAIEYLQTDIKYVEELLSEKLDSKVKVSDHKIEISYTNTADLNRILEILNIKED